MKKILLALSLIGLPVSVYASCKMHPSFESASKKSNKFPKSINVVYVGEKSIRDIYMIYSVTYTSQNGQITQKSFKMPTRIGELKNSSQHSFNIKKSDIIEKCLMEFKETITADLGKAYDLVINDISVKGMVSGAEKTSNKLNIDYSQYAAASTYTLTYTAGKLALERQ